MTEEMTMMEEILERTRNAKNSYPDPHNYKGVDGRVYQTEVQPEMPQTAPDYTRLYILQRGEEMSLKEIYQMDKFLDTGVRDTKAVPKAKDKERLIEEHGLVKDPKTHKYVGDKDQILATFKEKYPERAEKYSKFAELRNVVRYGAEPIPWSKPVEPKAWAPDRQKSPEKIVVNSKGFDKNNQWVATSQQKVADKAMEPTKLKDTEPSR